MKHDTESYICFFRLKTAFEEKQNKQTKKKLQKLKKKRKTHIQKEEKVIKKKYIYISNE